MTIKMSKTNHIDKSHSAGSVQGTAIPVSWFSLGFECVQASSLTLHFCLFARSQTDYSVILHIA